VPYLVSVECNQDWCDECEVSWCMCACHEDDTTEEWHDRLVNCETLEDGPSELSTITDVCASAKVEATLRDAAGFVRGHVEADGNWRLA
jgi:hypothetical protein